MSEKAACPNCDSYTSEVYYYAKHEWCGWNCSVQYRLDAYGAYGRDLSYMTKDRPTAEMRERVAGMVEVAPEEVHITVLVDGNEVVPDRLSAWLDPDREPPKPLNAAKREENLKALREQITRNALLDSGLS